MKIDVDELNDTELERLSLKIEERKPALAQERINAAVEEIETVVKKHDVALDDVLKFFTSTNRKRKLRMTAPKYKNPDDAKQTWTGMGRKPKWFSAHLEAGKALADLVI